MKKVFSLVLVVFLLAACGSSETSLFRKAKRLTAKGEYQKAISVYSTILKKNTSSAAAYANRGLLYERLTPKNAKELQQYKGMAKRDYERAIALNADQPEILNNLAALYIDEGDYDQAVLYLNRALSISPDYGLALINRGVVRSKQKRYGRALVDFAKAEEVSPTVLLFLNRALTEYAAGYYASAIDDWDNVLKLEPKNARAYLERGRALVKMGYFQDALEDFQRAIAFRADYAMPYFYAGELLFSRGDTDTGLAYAEQAANLAPNYAPVFEMLGDMLALESPVEATRHYLAARKLDPKNAAHYQQKIRSMNSEKGRKRIVFDRFANLEKK